MKISTILVTAVAGLSVLSGVVMAQHGGDMADHFAMVAKHLNLTPSQEKQLKAEHEALAKKLAAIENDSKLDEKAKGEARAKLHQEALAKAKTILNPDQLKALTGVMQVMAEHQEMVRIMGQLDLSSDQKASIHTVMSDAMEKMEAIHLDMKLTDAQRKSQAEQLHSAIMQKIHEILTPEQIEKAKQLHQASGHSIPPK